MTGSTETSSPSKNRFIDFLERYMKLYRQKGYWFFVALLIVVFHLHFFPMILKKVWPAIMETLTPVQFFALFGIGMHSGHCLVFNGVMYLIYTLKIPFFEKFRISDKKWPWESDPETWNKILKRSVKRLLFGHLVIVPSVVLVDYLGGGPHMRFDVESFPTTFESIKQILFFMICEDFMFYWNHRLLHHPRLYPYVHKIHHEYNITVSIASEYAHPIEFFLGNVIPASIGALILGNKVHFATYMLWNMLRLTEAVDGHCGYEFPWSPFGLLPFSMVSSYHNFHHSHNVGNYGSFFMFWDTLCGTNTHYFKHLENKEKKKLALKMQAEANKLNGKQENKLNDKVTKEIEKNARIAQEQVKSS